MKYADVEIKDLSDLALIQATQHCEQILKNRQDLASHPKFNDPAKKLAFPPPNPNFLKLLQELKTELASRDIKEYTNDQE